MEVEEEVTTTSKSEIQNEKILGETQEENVNEIESSEVVQKVSSSELGKIVVPGNDIIMKIDKENSDNINYEEYDIKNNEIIEIMENNDEENNGNDNEIANEYEGDETNEIINENDEKISTNEYVNESGENVNDNNNDNSDNNLNSNNNEEINTSTANNSNSTGNILSSKQEKSSSNPEMKSKPDSSNLKNSIHKLTENKSSEKISSIFNYTSIYSSINSKNDSFDKKMYNLHQHIEKKKQERLSTSSEKDEVKSSQSEKSENINLITLTKDNFLDILNGMGYEDITKLRNKLSEIGIYNQFNDILFDKQNKIIETVIEQKQELERKIHFQKEEIQKLRYSLECYESKMKYIRKKTLNDICNRCGISFDQYGYPHRVTVFGKPLLKEEIEEKTRIRSSLLENGLSTKPKIEQEINTEPLEVMNEYFFTKNNYDPHIEDYNESYDRIKEKQALNMLKSTTINEKIVLLTKQIKNAEITVRSCINALIEEQRRSSQLKAKYEKVKEILNGIENHKYQGSHIHSNNSHNVNGVYPLTDNKELVDTVCKSINDNTYVKLEEKYSTMKPNYLDKNPPNNKHNSNTMEDSGKNGHKNIPVIYVEEKTNSLNLELLEYKLETLSLLSKICLTDPPPSPLTNQDFINNENTNVSNSNDDEKESKINNESSNNRKSISNNIKEDDNKEDTTEDKNKNNDTIKENTIDETQKIIINEILNSQNDHNKSSKSTSRTINSSNTNFKKLDLKFSSDCKSLFNNKPTTSTIKVLTPKLPLTYDKAIDQISRNMDTSK
ncbi:hypothetical protein PIROE2DRAFT_62741 [Piromyces sp. E2]|nr:hypothetical protein PIROE2DRAFT_62741 [Piromyces sp. E2]|eukprot:OUM61067.1 hypothetical protein PIROE2DRAFT_62741 [Piromyces sp. E2]